MSTHRAVLALQAEADTRVGTPPQPLLVVRAVEAATLEAATLEAATGIEPVCRALQYRLDPAKSLVIRACRMNPDYPTRDRAAGERQDPGAGLVLH